MRANGTRMPRCARSVYYRPLRRPPMIWLQPQAGYRVPSGCTPLHRSILLAAVAIGLLLASVIASLLRGMP